MIWLVGLGGVCGAIARFWIGQWVASRAHSPFPWGTWLANVAGSFALGCLSGAGPLVPDWIYALAGIGFCGSFTTFSTFGYETMQLLETKRYFHAAAYIVSSVAICAALAWFGIVLSG